MINYSIIIPHKDIPDLLQRCLDSIPRRDDVQIIVVDDNSDADKVDFAHFPGLNDPFVEVIFGKNENGRKGAGYARNLGLERAKGKWLVFADADDFFMPCFNEVLDKYKDDENDIIYFKVTSVDSETLEPANRHLDINNILEKVQQNNDLDKLYGLSVPWGIFRKRNLVVRHHIRFWEIPCSNDVFFSIQYLQVTLKKNIKKDIIYCITKRKGSLDEQKTMVSLKIRFYVEYEAMKYIYSLIKGKIEYRNNVIYNCYWINIYDINKREAIRLLPRMIKVCGWVFICKKFFIQRNILGIGMPLYLFYRNYIKRTNNNKTHSSHAK